MPVLVVCCNEHFSVDGTLLPAWSSHGSFKPVDGQQEGGPDWWRTYVSPFATLPGWSGSGQDRYSFRSKAEAEAGQERVPRQVLQQPDPSRYSFSTSAGRVP